MKNNLLKQLETLGQSIWRDICLYREQKKIDDPAFSRHGHACPFRAGYCTQTKTEGEPA